LPPDVHPEAVAIPRQTPACRRSQQGGGGDSGCNSNGFHVSRSFKWNAAHPNSQRHLEFSSYLYKQNYHEIQTFFTPWIKRRILFIYNVLQI